MGNDNNNKDIPKIYGIYGIIPKKVLKEYQNTV